MAAAPPRRYAPQKECSDGSREIRVSDQGDQIAPKARTGDSNNSTRSDLWSTSSN